MPGVLYTWDKFVPSLVSNLSRTYYPYGFDSESRSYQGSGNRNTIRDNSTTVSHWLIWATTNGMWVPEGRGSILLGIISDRWIFLEWLRFGGVVVVVVLDLLLGLQLGGSFDPSIWVCNFVWHVKSIMAFIQDLAKNFFLLLLLLFADVVHWRRGDVLYCKIEILVAILSSTCASDLKRLDMNYLFYEHDHKIVEFKILKKLVKLIVSQQFKCIVFLLGITLLLKSLMPSLLPVLPVESTSKIMIILVSHRWLLPTNWRRCLNRWWLICDRFMTGKWFQDSHSVHVACFEELSLTLSLSPWQLICSRLITNIPAGIQFCCIKFLQYMQELNNMVTSTYFEFWNMSDLEIFALMLWISINQNIDKLHLL
jgi:hypothetical protein